MLEPNHSRFVKFRLKVEELLSPIVRDFEAQGLDSDEAYDRAECEVFHRLNSGRLPEFDELGGLPAAYRCSAEEFFQRFGSANARRRELSAAFSEVVRLGKGVGGRQIVGGSFVTSASEPNDIDATMLVSPNVIEQATLPTTAAHALLLLSQQVGPIQLYVERDEVAWWSWFRLFTQTRDPVHLYQGVVEIEL